jgi:two-component system, NarL family, sensor kinase
MTVRRIGEAPELVRSGTAGDRDRDVVDYVHHAVLQEPLFAAVLDSAIGLAITDTRRRFVAVNQAFCRITGYSERELLARNWVSVTHPKDRQRTLELALPLMAGEIPSFLIEKRYTRKNGRIVWVRNSTSVLLRDSSGKPTAFIVLAEDITEYKRAVRGLHQLSRRLLRLQDDERRRISRELHDVTGQNLAALQLRLESLLKDAAGLDRRSRKALSESVSLAKQAAREIRTLSYLLHPALLDEFGLADALRYYVRGFADRSGIEVELRYADEVPRMEREKETALFRVVQEALNNVLQHSGSKKVAIDTERRSDGVLLRVRDFGRRLRGRGELATRPKPMATGVGIASMRERVEQFGGNLKVDFGRSGTTICAFLPLQAA